MSTTALKAPSDLYGTQLKTEYGDYDVSAAGLVTVDSRLVATLLGAGFVPVDGQQVQGTYTAVAGDATANEAVIDTGLDAITSFNVQVFRAGVNVMEDAIVTVSGGELTVADGGATYAVTAGDVINYMVTGY